MVAITIAPRRAGSLMLKIVRNGPAPSMAAASYSSFAMTRSA
jgi:hypothetical protein